MPRLQPRLIMASVLLSIIGTTPVSAQNAEKTRELLVMLRPGIHNIVPSSGQRSLDSLRLSDTVKQALVGAGITSFSSALPGFSKGDTLTITPDGKKVRLIDWTNLLRLNVPLGRDMVTLIKTLNSHPEIWFAEKNTQFTARNGGEYIPDESETGEFHRQWNMRNTGQGTGVDSMDTKATFAWDTTKGSSQFQLALIDPYGIRPSHQDLKDYQGVTRVIGDQGFDQSHGTFAAGMAAATGDNGLGIAGMDWKVKLINEYIPERDTESLIDAINSAIQRGADVINSSFGGNTWAEGPRVAYMQAYHNNIFLATANRATYDPEPHLNNYGFFMHNVAGHDNEGLPAEYTLPTYFTALSAPGGENAGAEQRLYGPGASHNSEYVEWWGTSFAAPHAAGLASLMLSVDSDLRNYDIQWIQIESADDMGPNQAVYGYGRLNAREAIRRLQTPFEISRGNASLGMHTSGLFYFASSPDGWRGEEFALPHGLYNVEIHKLEASVPFGVTYDSPPWAWLSQIGYPGTGDPAAVNYHHIYKSITTTEMTLYTYFYWIDSTLSGEVVGRWVPFDPYYFPTEYTILGVPDGPPPPPPPELPSAPTGLWGTYFPPDHGGPKVELQWNRNPPDEGVDKYRLARAIEEGEFNVVAKAVPDPGSGSKVYYTDYMRIPPGTEYVRYKVRAHNDEGWGPFCDPVIVECGFGPLMAGGSESLPTELTLDPNYPNPFNPTTQIKFGLPAATHVRLQIMNVRGQTIRVLVDEQRAAGWYTVTWDSKNEAGRDVASGIYLYLIEADNKKILKKLTLIR